jgi:hypothetical protein
MFQVRKDFTFNGKAYKAGDAFDALTVALTRLCVLELTRLVVRVEKSKRKRIFKKDKA